MANHSRIPPGFSALNLKTTNSGLLDHLRYRDQTCLNNRQLSARIVLAVMAVAVPPITAYRLNRLWVAIKCCRSCRLRKKKGKKKKLRSRGHSLDAITMKSLSYLRIQFSQSLMMTMMLILPTCAPLVTVTAISPGWHPPNATNTNNLTFAVFGPGVNGFIYDSSSTADSNYGVYNYCNMPHVRAREYVVPDQDVYELEYVEVIQRHHKRSPYQSNTFPAEDREWPGCGDTREFYYGQPTPGFDAAKIYVSFSPTTVL